jgi:hypothetical protein
MVCPEINGVGILQASWDTRATGISNSIDSYVKDDGWAGVHWAPQLKLTQKCWDITGTYGSDCGGGPVTGTMKIDPITKQFIASGTWSDGCDNDSDGKKDGGNFALTMAADNQSFKGFLLVIPPDSPDTGSYPENWAGKKL